MTSLSGNTNHSHHNKTKTKNIAFLIYSLEGGGAEKSVLTLAKEMTSRGHNVHIILLKNKVDYKIDSKVKIHHFPVPPKRGLRKLFYYNIQGLRIKKFIARLEQTYGPFNLIVSNLTEPDRIMSAINLSRTYFCIRNATSKQKFGDKNGLSLFLRRRKYQQIYNNRDIIAISEGIARDLVDIVGVKPKSIKTIYNSIDIEWVRTQSNEDIEVPYDDYIINVASFKDQKRHDVLLKAFAKSGLKCRLILLGQGKNEQKIKKLVKELGLEDKVVFAGFKPNPYPWIKKAKMLVLSSDYEGFARVILEAIVCGVTVVSTNCPAGTNEILCGELSRGLVPVGDVNALADKMHELYGVRINMEMEDLDRFSVQNIVDQFLFLSSDN